MNDDLREQLDSAAATFMEAMGRLELLGCPFCGKEPMRRDGMAQCDEHTYPLSVEEWQKRTPCP